MVCARRQSYDQIDSFKQTTRFSIAGFQGFYSFAFLLITEISFKLKYLMYSIYMNFKHVSLEFIINFECKSI